jgi:hypothetical protein
VGRSHLAIYLNDHLGGATGAIELIDHVQRAHADAPVASALGPLRADIDADKRQLHEIVARLTDGGTGVRRAAGWLGERLMRLKLAVDDPSDGSLRLFESIELLSLGLEGKKALWGALATAAAQVPELQGVDYDRLIARAEQQRATLEPYRLDAARAALASDDGK